MDSPVGDGAKASAQRTVIAHSRGYAVTAALNIADRDDFLTQRDHPELQREITIPVASRARSGQILHITRRLSAPNGAFLGLVLDMI